MLSFRKFKYKIKYYLSPVPRPEKWLFIVGCSNSGTTLLHSILSLHSSIGSLPDEGQFCTNQLPLGKDVGPKRLWAIPPEKLYLDENSASNIDLVKLKKHWAARYNDLGRSILMEKSPPNIMRLRWLQANFNNAYFIGIHRNGYAVAEGIKRKIGHPVELGAKQWSNTNSVLLEDLKYLNNKLLISYEELTEQPESTIEKICHFLSIEPLNATLLKNKFKIHGNTFEISNMNQKSIEVLSPEELNIIERESHDCLKKLNYFQNFSKTPLTK